MAGDATSAVAICHSGHVVANTTVTQTSLLQVLSTVQSRRLRPSSGETLTGTTAARRSRLGW